MYSKLQNVIKGFLDSTVQKHFVYILQLSLHTVQRNWIRRLGRYLMPPPSPPPPPPVTGHADGTVRFWDTTGSAMQPLYRLKTQKLFEKNKAGGAEVLDEDPYAVTKICLAPDCRTLAVAGQTDQVLLYRYGSDPITPLYGKAPALQSIQSSRYTHTNKCLLEST